MDTRPKLNVHKLFIWRTERQVNVSRTLKLGSESTWIYLNRFNLNHFKHPLRNIYGRKRYTR